MNSFDRKGIKVHELMEMNKKSAKLLSTYTK